MLKPVKTLQIILVMVFFLAATSSNLLAQTKVEPEKNKFTIVVEASRTEVILHCPSGCAWERLSYTLNDRTRNQAIDEFGTTKLGEVNLFKDEKLANFLFTIEPTSNGFSLKGLEGTAWTDLNFSVGLNQKRAFNQFGTTELE